MTMDHPTQPRAAAWPDSKELLSATALDIYIGCGFEAVAGWPLKNGWLPVAVPPIGVVHTTPAEWELYMALCYGESLMWWVNP